MTTLNVAVAASSDDAQQSAGTVTLTDGVLNCNNTGMYGGMRFDNITIPPGSTINSATLSINLISTSYDSPDVTIFCEDADDAATFSASSNNISNRSMTTGTAWTATNIGVGVKTTPDFAADLQEVIDRAGWASGNAIVVIIKGDSASSELRFSTWDSTNPEPEIDIDYTAPALQTLTGATIAAGTTLYAGTIAADTGQSLTGATIASTTTLYAGQVNLTIGSATIAAGTTLYAGVLAFHQELEGATIAATTALYAGQVDIVLTGATIAAGTQLYAGAVSSSWGVIQLDGYTFHDVEYVNSASFHHETPAGDDRLLLLIATYYDTVGVNSGAWGSNGAGDGEFNKPLWVAVDSGGNVYVTDFDNHRVQKFDSDGAYIGQWGSNGSGNGEFEYPQGIAVDSNDYVYVVDLNNHRVQKFDTDGTYISQWGGYSPGGANGGFNNPRGVAVSPAGYVYVTDTENHRIQKFDTDGTYISQWGWLGGLSGTEDGQFNNPFDIAVDSDNNVYVLDTYNYRVQKFDSDGNFITKWGEYGTGGNGEFRLAFGIYISPFDHVYVADSANSRIQVFDSDGNFITAWGNFGSGDGQFNYPEGIAGNSNYLYIADVNNYRIQKFDVNLKLVTAYYGDEQMTSGPLVDGGNYFQAFFTLANPPVGDYEVSIAAPSKPDSMMLTAMSFSGVNTATTDYGGADAGLIETETNTTALQISHSRAIPTGTLSIFSTLYDTGGTTESAAADNSIWITRNIDNLTQTIGFRYHAAATSGSKTYGISVSPSVTPRITGVIHVEMARGDMTAGAYIEPTTTLYAGVATLEGQTMYGAFISAGSALTAGAVGMVVTGVTIAATTALYAGVADVIPGPDQTIRGVFIGMGQPRALQGPFISAADEFFAGVLTSNRYLTGAVINSTAYYAGTIASYVSTPSAHIYAGVIDHVL